MQRNYRRQYRLELEQVSLRQTADRAIAGFALSCLHSRQWLRWQNADLYLRAARLMTQVENGILQNQRTIMLALLKIAETFVETDSERRSAARCK
jgi:hypothetical protein